VKIKEFGGTRDWTVYFEYGDVWSIQLNLGTQF
jgi:hypothetical protein